jgi:hypothetical protein
MLVPTQQHTTLQITSRNGQQITTLNLLIFSILLATPPLKNVAIFILHIYGTPAWILSLTETDFPTLSWNSSGMSVFGVQPRTQVGLSGVLYRLGKAWKAILLILSLTTFNMLKGVWHHSVNLFKPLEYSSLNPDFSTIRFGETALHAVEPRLGDSSGSESARP